MDINTLIGTPRPDDVAITMTPGERECLPCYLNRMLTLTRCDNHLHWAEIWGRQNNVRGLRRWLQSNGGYCDCEVLFNVYPDVLPADDASPLEPCRGMRAPGSTQPCAVYDAAARVGEHF